MQWLFHFNCQCEGMTMNIISTSGDLETLSNVFTSYELFSGKRNLIEWIKAPIFLEAVLAIEIM